MRKRHRSRREVVVTMTAEHSGEAARKSQPVISRRIRQADSYGIVLGLIVLDYITVSALAGRAWGRVIIIFLLGATFLFALRTSHARGLLQLLAAAYLLISTLVALVSVVAPGAPDISQQVSIAGGLLLIITPVAIVRRVSAHQVVTTESVLGAVCVYLLIGFSFAFIYLAINFFSPASFPFFAGQPHATANDYLFFSYTTLTTVGYGNLVPAGNIGQTFAMLEALFGQIYLVIIVARLVALWGQARTRPELRPPEDMREDTKADTAQQRGDAPAATPAPDVVSHNEKP